MVKADLAPALADVDRRSVTLDADHESVRQQMIALNQRGVEIEKLQLVLDGERKALTALLDGCDA